MNKTLGLGAIILLASAFQSAHSADIEAGKAKAVMCASCHGAAGISPSEAFPNLAGQKATYTATQLKAFKTGTRANPIMAGMANPLTDADIDNLAAYYASLKP
jgi:cytochrome c553